MYLPHTLLVVTLAVLASADNSTITPDTCFADRGVWSSLLVEWAISAPSQNTRQGRIMALPPAQGYYVSDRIDLMPPPPPPRLYPTTQHLPHPSQYNEWQASPPPPMNPGKIVNRPPNPYKDKFKPSYPAPPQNQPIPVNTPQHPYAPGGLVDRVDETKPAKKPQKQVSETDLYLLTAIEKLVFRVDLMEKRLRRMEENVHYVLAGTDVKPEPCVKNFTRVGSSCYYFSTDAINWKNANYACRKLKGNLLELDTDDEKRHLISGLLAEKRLKGADYWTGGLNPGLLWIWSHSAKPVASNTTNTSSAHTIPGDGRCLALVHDPAIHNYIYRGQDCALRHRYVCEKEEDGDKLGNEIERVAKQLKKVQKTARVLIGDGDPSII